MAAGSPPGGEGAPASPRRGTGTSTGAGPPGPPATGVSGDGPAATGVSGDGPAATEVSGDGPAATGVSGDGPAVTGVSGDGPAATEVAGHGPAAAPRRDPLLDTVERKAAAGASPEAPFGRPGLPLDRRSPFAIGFVGALGVAAAYVLLRAVVLARGALVLLFVAAFLAVGLAPAVNFLVRRGVPRAGAVTLVVLAGLGLVVGFFALIIPPFVSQTTAFVHHLPSYLTQLERGHGALGRFVRREQLVKKLKDAASKASSVAPQLLGGVVGVGKAVLSTLADTVIVVVLTVYFLADLPRLTRTLYRLVPRSRRPRTSLLLDAALSRIGGFLIGNLATSVVAAIGTAVFAVVAGIPFAAPLAVLVGVFDLVPVVGSSIGGLVVTLVALTVSVPVAVASLAFYVCYRLVEDYLLIPRVMHATVEVSALVSLVALLVGAALFGLIGALVAIPVAASIKLVVTEVFFPRLDEL